VPPDPDALIDAMAPLVGLTIAPAWREGVVTHLAAAVAAAALMAEWPQDDDAEPAPVFRPGDPA
jgi:hypothetical protein